MDVLAEIRHFKYLDNLQRARTQRARQPVGKYSVMESIQIARRLGSNDEKEIIKHAKYILQFVIEKRQVAGASELIERKMNENRTFQSN